MLVERGFAGNNGMVSFGPDLIYSLDVAHLVVSLVVAHVYRLQEYSEDRTLGAK